MTDQSVTVTLQTQGEGYRYTDPLGNVYRIHRLTWRSTGPRWGMHGPEGYAEFATLQEIREALGHE